VKRAVTPQSISLYAMSIIEKTCNTKLIFVAALIQKNATPLSLSLESGAVF
jgi:hypothetical protein